jgi:penicillin-binding protein 1A
VSEDDRADIAPTGRLLPFRRRGSGEGRPRIRKLRLVAILLGLALIAVVSTVFGMMMAVAADLPSLDHRAEFKTARNSIVYDDKGRPLGILASKENRIFVPSSRIPPVVKHAVVAVEDRRFYTNNGVDIPGIARAFLQDVQRKKAVQGASTIAQQFVKNALRAQNRRTIFEKLRESALAYHLTRRWSKERILTEYLNSIYYGNGAYGIEAAARTYFGQDANHQGCGTPHRQLCVQALKPHEAALLAGIISSPAAYDPIVHPQSSRRRRNLVLKDMLEQGYITQTDYDSGVAEAIPARADVQSPRQAAPTPETPFFIDWIKQQVVDRYGVRRAFEGGLKIHTTLDLDMQRAAEQTVQDHLSDPSGPTASLVAIDNDTGEVRAMVGGPDYRRSSFNLATEGQRQPGSSFKVFVLAQALREGISPDSVWPSEQRVFTVPNSRGQERFVVRNFANAYNGSSTLAHATAVSDNSVFAAVGIKAGVKRISRLASRMGIRSPVSHNLAITLGGLKRGVTPLDMAHAYETLAHNGERVMGTLGAPGPGCSPSISACPTGGPVGIREVDVPGQGVQRNSRYFKRILPKPLVSTENDMLTAVLTEGTAKSAALGQWAAGKTGTTENYGDAWFVGFTRKLTVAVWVGYPNGTKSMRTDYGGSPVEGGTFPADIWHEFMIAATDIQAQQAANQSSGQNGSSSSSGSGSSSSTAAGSGGGSGSSGGGGSGGSSSSSGGGSSSFGGGSGGSSSSSGGGSSSFGGGGGSGSSFGPGGSGSHDGGGGGSSGSSGGSGSSSGGSGGRGGSGSSSGSGSGGGGGPLSGSGGGPSSGGGAGTGGTGAG